MLILAKSALVMMLGFIMAIILGIILIPILKSHKIGQKVSLQIGERHLSKDGTPTLGGLIFIIPTVVTMLLLWLRGSIELSSNIIILLVVFIGYALLGFADDYLKLKFKNNAGLKIMTKLIIQTFIALIFFYIYMKNGNEPVVEITSLGFEMHLGWVYGLFILLVLVGSSNAVNITDGLDGLAGGLSAIAFLAYGLLAWNAGWLQGYQEIAIFCFCLVGSLLGFLFYNTHPAKIFMGDTGSLSLGAALGTVAILTKHELLLVVVGGVFVVETLSSMIQMIAIIKFNKKIFLMAPLHHHFEQLGWAERDIVKLFWVAGLLLAMGAVTYGVWI